MLFFIYREISVLNVEPNAVSNKLFGSNFFYTVVKTRLEYYSTKGTIFCLEIEMQTKPL